MPILIGALLPGEARIFGIVGGYLFNVFFKLRLIRLTEGLTKALKDKRFAAGGLDFKSFEAAFSDLFLEHAEALEEIKKRFAVDRY